MPAKLMVFMFQSTLPLRGVTWLSVEATPLLTFQSTLPLRGVTMHVTISPSP